MKLDAIDRNLLELLQIDSKQTNKELSNKLVTDSILNTILVRELYFLIAVISF